MTPKEMRSLAILCTSSKPPNESDKYVFVLCEDDLAAYTAAVGAPLQDKIDRLKTVPMKYRRMEFNAQLQSELDKANARIAQLEEALNQVEPLLRVKWAGAARQLRQMIESRK